MTSAGADGPQLLLIPSYSALLCSALPVAPRPPRLPTATTMPIPRRPCHHGRTVPLPLHLVLVLLLSLLCPTKAQPSGSTSQDQYGNLRGSFGPSMGIIIVILVTAFFFMVFFSIYLRRCSERADLSVRPSGTGARALEGARSRRSEAARGLDSAVVQALPTLVYAEVKEHKIGKGALECAICLNEFEDDEALRLLPSCDHVFHTHCIDAWLSSHTTCPVCRCNLAAPDPNTTEAAVTTASPQAAGASDATIFSEETDHEREGGAGEQQNHVAIVVDETGEQQDQLRRMESKSRLRWRWSRSMPRSHSTGHSVGVAGQGDDCERYTLRLPEHIRKDVMAGKFQGSSSSVAGESKRHPVGGEGTSHGGRSFKLRRWEWAAKSDRWAFFTRTLSMVVSRGDDSGVGEGSSRKGGDGGRGRGIRQGEDVSAV